jgi:RNA polymerase sigma-70 factor (ECF subfamily)
MFSEMGMQLADDDAILVRRCLDGDALSMRRLVERYQGRVFGLCHRMLGHREDAEDVAQDVFLRVFRSLRSWDSQRPLKPWLLAIAANRCRTALGKRAREPASREFHENSRTDKAPVDTDDMAEELQLALGTLREEYRMCFILFYQQELSCAETAEIMQCPEGTVKTWLHRARRKLAEYLQRRGVVTDAGYELHRI